MEKNLLNNPKKKQRGPGHPTSLTNKLLLQIRKMYLAGYEVKEIQSTLGIKPATWESWYYRDTQGLRDGVTKWRREKMLVQAEKNLEQFSVMPTEIQEIEDSDGENGPKAVVVTDPRLVKIKLDATTYLTDTLGKDTYSKRIIQDDPNAAKKTELDEVRHTLKNIMLAVKGRGQTSAKDKMLSAIKK